MKDKITITLENDLLDAIDKEMIRHQYSNKSKFLEFLLRQVLYNPQKRLVLLERQREFMLSKFKVMNEDILKLQEHIELLQKAEEKLNEPREDTKNSMWVG